MNEPLWILEARKHIGQREITGSATNSRIAGWLKTLKAWWSDDETPWCGTFAAHCIRSATIPVPKYWMRARDWLNWGRTLQSPVYGCVVVFERDGGGHVGFVVGKDKLGNIMVLGGNQGDSVKISPFSTIRVIGYRWPLNEAIPPRKILPLLESDGQLSRNEA